MVPSVTRNDGAAVSGFPLGISAAGNVWSRATRVGSVRRQPYCVVYHEDVSGADINAFIYQVLFFSRVEVEVAVENQSCEYI